MCFLDYIFNAIKNNPTVFVSFLALFVTLGKIWWDKYQEDEKKKKEHYNNFHYFETIVGMIMESSKKQLTFYEEFIVKVRAEPTNTQAITIVINENLKRVVKDFNQEKFFHSFIKQFNAEDQKRAIEIFLNIYNRLDLYLKSYDNAIVIDNFLRKSLMESDKQYMLIFTEKVNPEIREVESTLKAVNKDLYDKFSIHLLAYSGSTRKNTDFQSHVVEPLLTKDEFYSSTIFTKLINYCNEMKAIYNKMESASLFNAGKMEELKDDLAIHLKEINELRQEYRKMLD